MPKDVVEIINAEQKEVNSNKSNGFVSKELIVYKLIRAFRNI